MFLGRSTSNQNPMSPTTVESIDGEIRAVIDRNYDRARQLLVDNMDIMHSMAAALIKYETIDIAQLEKLMDRKDPGPPADWDDSGDSGNGTPAESNEATDESLSKQHGSDAGESGKDGDDSAGDDSIDGATSLH